MDPIRFSIENPVKVSVGVILILMFGLLAYSQIPVQLTPNVDKPVISVTTRWEGASPSEVETDIIIEQEDKLKGVSGLQKMISVSEQSQAQITLEFPVGVSKEAARIEVSDKLREVPSYPENVDEPVVADSDPRDRDYIAWVILSSSDQTYDIRQLQKWADDVIKPELERVPGVSEVNVLGGTEPEVQVQVDPVRMAELNITPAQLADALRTRNVNISAGDIREDKVSVRLRATGKYERVQEIDDTVLTPPGEPIVRVKDVGKAVLTYKEPEAFVRSRGVQALAINAQRESGSNVMQVMQGFRAAIERLNETALPTKAEEVGLPDLNLRQVYDQTIYIDSAIALVVQNLFIGGGLAVIVLLLFLTHGKQSLMALIAVGVLVPCILLLIRFEQYSQPWWITAAVLAITVTISLIISRATSIIALAIPVSIIGTFVAMVALGRNINVISLAGLSFAVGIVVDNAIVVLENIDRHLHMGKKPREAALHGAQEVWGAILASTLTTLAVFLPVIFVQEEAGQLFRDIALAICAAVSLSLVVSIMVIPAASARFLHSVKPHEKPVRRSAIGKAFGGITALPRLVVNGIANTVGWLTRTWLLRLALVIVIAGGAVWLSFVLMPPASYLPEGNRNLVFAMMIPPPGYSLEKMSELGHRIEAQVGPYWEAEPGTKEAEQLPPVMNFNPMTGEAYPVQVPPLENFFFVGLQSGVMFMGGISSDADRVQPVAALLNNAIQPQPGIIGFATQRSLFNTGGSEGITLDFTGPSLDGVVQAAGATFGVLVQHPMFGPRAARPDPGNFNIPGEEVQVRINPVRSSEVGINNRELATATQMLGDGAIIDDFVDRGDSIDFRLVVDPELAPEWATAIDQIPLANAAGPNVPLGSIAKVVRTTSPQQIKRIERQRAVSIEISLPADVALEDAEAVLRDQIIPTLRRQGAIPPTVQANLAGTAASLQQVKAALLGEWTGFNQQSIASLLTSRMFLALLVTVLLMAALFESWLYPLVIMFSVPAAMVGGFIGLAVVHAIIPSQQLDVLTMLGFVILVGIVVNNAILIVHQTLNFLKGAESDRLTHKINDAKDAIRESVRSRVRPILMSTMTSVGGMLPLVLFPGAGSELYRGLGSVVVGGLLLSAVFTLLLVPLVLSLVFDLRKVVVGSAATMVAPASND